MHGNLEPEESVWKTEPTTYPVHPEMADVDLNSEELAFLILSTFLENSITASWRPRQIPKNGTLDFNTIPIQLISSLDICQI